VLVDAVVVFDPAYESTVIALIIPKQFCRIKDKSQEKTVMVGH